MKRIKLVIATGIYPPSIGGPATYSKLLYDKFPSMGIDVSVETFDSVRMYPRVISHIIYFVRLLNTAIGKDIILAQDTVSVGLPALCVSKILRKPFFVRVPGDYAWEQSVQRFDVKEGIDEFQTKKYGLR